MPWLVKDIMESLIIDCSKGEEYRTPLTKEEIASRKQQQLEVEAQEREQERLEREATTRRNADVAMVKQAAAHDAKFAALARLAGIDV